MKKKTTLTLTSFAVLVIVITALGSVVWVMTRPPSNFDDMDAFSATWLATPEEDRHELLPWLLGQEPARHTVYPVDQSRLAGLSRDEVMRYMGLHNGTGGHNYFIGSIESDFLGNLIVPKRDHLNIQYDENGIIESIETIS